MIASDLLVLYDCVQFPRRGWLHRNRLRTSNGSLGWLTLPLMKTSRGVLIRDLEFRKDATARIGAQLRRFSTLTAPPPHARALVRALQEPTGAPVDYIVELLRIATHTMGLPWRVIRSSDLAVSPSTRGQDRILAIAEACGATRYVNTPGGRTLYRQEEFSARNIELCFLPDYEGSQDSIAQRLTSEDPLDVAAEIRAGL